MNIPNLENYVNDMIIEFDQIEIEKLEISINEAFDNLGIRRELFLTDMLERAENLECYNVCIVVSKLLKNGN